MKKNLTAAILILLMSLQIFVGAYEVTKLSEVKMSKREMDSNGKQIEEVFRSYLEDGNIRKEIEKGIKEGLTEEYTKESTEEELLFLIKFVSITISTLENTKWKLVGIEYLSSEEASVKFEITAVNIEKLDEQMIEKKAEEKFKKKLGMSLTDVIGSKLSKKEWENTILESIHTYIGILSDEMSKIKEYNTDTGEIRMHKVNGQWKIEEFF